MQDAVRPLDIHWASVHVHPRHARWNSFYVKGRGLQPPGETVPDLQELEVIVRLGTFEETLPAGAFRKQHGRWVYVKPWHGGGDIRWMQIRPDGRFQVFARGMDLEGTDFTQPVKVSIRLGTDEAAQEIAFQKRHKHFWQYHKHER